MITQLRQSFSSVDAKQWGLAELGLDAIYYQFKSESLGCSATCPTCGRKCDRPLCDGPGKHKHACSLGHQLRGMAGVRVANDMPSFLCCDEISDGSDVQLVGKKKWVKWSDVKKQYPEWDFAQTGQTAAQRTQRIRQFRECWNHHGKKLCAHFTKCALPMNYCLYKARNMHMVFVVNKRDICGDSHTSRLLGDRLLFTIFLDLLMQLVKREDECHVSLIVTTATQSLLVLREKSWDSLQSTVKSICDEPGAWNALNNGVAPIRIVDFADQKFGSTYMKSIIVLYQHPPIPPLQLDQLVEYIRRCRRQHYRLLTVMWYGAEQDDPVYKAYNVKYPNAISTTRADQSEKGPGANAEYIQVRFQAILQN
jgi:hypothetical protein